MASCFMVVNDGSYATGCVVSASEEEGAMVTVGTVITVYIAADPSVQITTTPEEPAATEPTTPETPPEAVQSRNTIPIKQHTTKAEAGALNGLPLLLV